VVYAGLMAVPGILCVLPSLETRSADLIREVGSRRISGASPSPAVSDAQGFASHAASCASLVATRVARWLRPQSRIAISTGISEWPKSVRLYSTLGGTSA
jgi:hypothetical protein